MKELSTAQCSSCSWPISSSDGNPNDEKHGGESANMLVERTKKNSVIEGRTTLFFYELE